ncbi:MAG: hypothetical protein GF398_10400 [Chitinivibrionales bacterium]|nr:hypothetical protein [Chitinivibrionales bacterium]
MCADSAATRPQETSVSTITLDENGILHQMGKPGATFTLERAREEFEAIRRLAQNRRLPIVVDIHHAGSVTREARRYYAGHEFGECIAAAALLIGNPVSKIIGNFFLGLNKPLFPTKLFTEEQSALNWLQTIVT